MEACQIITRSVRAWLWPFRWTLVFHAGVHALALLSVLPTFQLSVKVSAARSVRAGKALLTTVSVMSRVTLSFLTWAMGGGGLSCSFELFFKGLELLYRFPCCYFYLGVYCENFALLLKTVYFRYCLFKTAPTPTPQQKKDSVLIGHDKSCYMLV